MSKELRYKLEILYVKYSPFVISFLIFIYHLCRFLSPIDLMWLQYLCMPSLFTSGHMLNTRQMFGLCKTHKCFVYYVMGNLLICLIEHYWVVPLMNVTWMIFILIWTILILFLGIYYYKKEHEKLNILAASANCR